MVPVKRRLIDYSVEGQPIMDFLSFVKGVAVTVARRNKPPRGEGALKWQT